MNALLGKEERPKGKFFLASLSLSLGKILHRPAQSHNQPVKWPLRILLRLFLQNKWVRENKTSSLRQSSGGEAVQVA